MEYKIKIAIATNKNFYKLSLPIIINSLIECGISKSDIYVFNGGFDEEKLEVVDEITYYSLCHNSIDYTPLIAICEKNIESDYWFLIHDTCRVGKNFKKLLYNIPEGFPDKVALKSKPSMSIGLYKYEYLKSIEGKILSTKNTDYSRESIMRWKNWGVANEDYILWMTEPRPHIYNNMDSYSLVAYENWYNTETIRRTEYYASLDLYKNKSNWGQTGNNMVVNI